MFCNLNLIIKYEFKNIVISKVILEQIDISVPHLTLNRKVGGSFFRIIFKSFIVL